MSKEIGEILLEVFGPEFKQEVMARRDLVHLIGYFDHQPTEIKRFVSQWNNDWPKFLTETFLDRILGVPATIDDDAVVWGDVMRPLTLKPGDYGSSLLSPEEEELWHDINVDPLIQSSLDHQRRKALVAKYGNESFIYEPTPYDEIRDIQSRIQVDKGGVIYDLGSGYGRFVLFGALTTQARYKGIELVEQRADISKSAAERLSIPNIEIIQGNVRNVDFSDGTVFYMFDPFCPSTERVVRDKLRSVGATKPITVITKGDVVDMAFVNQPWLQKVDEVRVGQTSLGNFIGTRIYRSTPVAQAA